MVGVPAALDRSSSRRAVLVCAAHQLRGVTRSAENLGSSDSQTYWRSISIPSRTSMSIVGVSTSGEGSAPRCHEASAQPLSAHGADEKRPSFAQGQAGSLVVEQDEGDVRLLAARRLLFHLLVEPAALRAAKMASRSMTCTAPAGSLAWFGFGFGFGFGSGLGLGFG